MTARTIGPADAQRYEVVGGGFDDALFAAAALDRHDRVLDVGCGYGSTTLRAARIASAGSALGNDIVAPFLAHARRTAAAEGLANAAFEEGDAQVHPFPAAAFDVVISRFGAMLFADPVAAYANLGRALRPDGRIAVAVLGDPRENDLPGVLAIALRDHMPRGMDESGAPGPSSLANPRRIREILAAAGFRDVDTTRVESRIELGRDPAEAATFLHSWSAVNGAVAHLDETATLALLDELARLVEPFCDGGAVRLRSTAWLVTATHPS